MPRELSNILDVTKTMGKKWTVLVQVIDHGNVQMSNANKKFRRLLFSDSQGTRVSAVIFSESIDDYANTFKPYEHFYISNAKLLDLAPRYRVGPYIYSWMLSKQTLVEPLKEDATPPLPCQFNFTPFSQLYKHAETDSYQNIRGIVIKSFPSEHVIDEKKNKKKRDVVVVNEEKKLIRLTLWDSFDENEGSTLEELSNSNPIIFALQVKVTTFYGISLSTSKGSTILINPPVNEDQQLDKWHAKNKTEIQELLENDSWKDVDALLPFPGRLK